MSISVTVPISALNDPLVSAAFVNLLSALGAAPLSARIRRAPKRRIDHPLPEGDLDANYEAFLTALPERSRRFLKLLQARNTLNIDEAMEALDVKVGKAMGGITGSIARWAPEHGVTVPFEAIKGPGGKRTWRWIGLGHRPAPPVPVRARRRRETTNQPAEVAPVMHDLTALQAALPEDTARFVTLLQTRGELQQAEVLDHFRLARAQALSRILSPLQASGPNALTDQVVTMVSATGERSWVWGVQEGTTPAELQAPEHTGVSTDGHPGVRVRRRA